MREKMKIKVLMPNELWNQFSKEVPVYTQVREVEIPDEEIKHLRIHREDYFIDGLLDLAFKYGQNDFQVVEPGMRSVSVGDVVWITDTDDYYKVEGLGFSEVYKSELKLELK